MGYLSWISTAILITAYQSRRPGSSYLVCYYFSVSPVTSHGVPFTHTKHDVDLVTRFRLRNPPASRIRVPFESRGRHFVQRQHFLEPANILAAVTVVSADASWSQRTRAIHKGRANTRDIDSVQFVRPVANRP